jgi:hypothetical protein
MNEFEALITKAEKYLNSAELLLKASDYDSSVSRSYYAMLYATQALLLTKSLSVSSHRGIIAVFGEHFIKTGIFSRETGKKLNRAFEKRQIGDYKHTFVITKEEASEVLENGREFLTEVVDYLQENKFLS